MTWSVRMAQCDYELLQSHLFPGDRDEHAAFLYAGEMEVAGGRRLLIRQVVPVPDEQFGPSDQGGYRQISAPAVARAAMYCEENGLRLVWAHSHPEAGDRVGFSPPDRATHARAHPGLIDMTGGRPVTSLVFGSASVDGEIWDADGTVDTLAGLDVVGARLQRLTACPQSHGRAATRFHRQALMFGDEGQHALGEMSVAVLGAGGGGSLLVQGLAHLGVGKITVVDFDRVSETNLSRIVGAEPRDARRRRLKVDVMKRMVERIDPSVEFVGLVGDVSYVDGARAVTDSDFIFSATDSMLGRYAFNTICHQYLIPGAQVGAKVVIDPDAGDVSLAYSMHRPIDFHGACLECAGAIDPQRLHREQLGEIERRAQDYLDADTEIVDPSVISLNSMATSMALIDFQLAATGLQSPGVHVDHRVYHALDRALRDRESVPCSGCRMCDRSATTGLFARGDDMPLPLRVRASAGAVRQGRLASTLRSLRRLWS